MTTVSTTPGPAAIGADDKELAPGLEVGEYRIESVLGRGGFGTVYGAVQPVIGKRVAIKVLARKYAADQDIVSRFAAEARAVNQIRHRNIIDIFSFGQLADGRHYYVMEHLDGEPLDMYLKQHGAMTLDQALPILRAVAKALDAAHAKGIAHRDLKPENIFLAVDPDGRSESGRLDLGPDGGVFPKLLDFGIAKLLGPEEQTLHRTGTGVPIGTPYFMSPEQCRGRDVDHRTDIYSFGVVCYRVLTGAFPFEGDFMELLFKQVNEEPPPPTSINRRLPVSVDTAIAWMMRKDRAQRPPSVLEAVNALDPDNALRLTPMPRPSKPSVGPTGRGPQTTPANLALAETGISSPNALADTRVSTQNAGARVTAGAARRSHAWLWAVVVVVLATLGTGVYLKTRGKPAPIVVSVQESHSTGSGSAEQAKAVPDEPAKPPAVSADAAVTPETVIVTITGAPAGAEVHRDGKLIGLVPKLSLTYSTKEQYLVVEAGGYQPLPITVVPDQDRTLPVVMRKKTTRTVTPAAKPPNPDDVEDPFKKKK